MKARPQLHCALSRFPQQIQSNETMLALYRKMQIGLFAVFAALLVVGAVSYGALLEVRNSQQWVRHSNEVRVQLAKLGWAIEKTQAAARAFALSGDDAFLREALAARTLADNQRIVLLELTDDNQDQQRRLAALTGLAPPISLEAAKTIGNGSLAAALESYRPIPGEMEQAELQLLTERESQMVRYFRRAELTMALASIFGLAFVVVTGGIARRDSTLARKIRAEDAERMRVLVDGVQDYAIFMLDPIGKVLSWNDGARRTKGYQSAEIIGQNFSRFYPQSDIDAGLPEEELRLAAANGRSEVERWRVRKDGSRFQASLVITAARDSVGTLIGFSEISRDISERKGTDAKYRGLLEAAPDAMVVVDQGGNILLLNVQAEKQFGYRRDELLGQKVTDIIPEGFAERLIADGTRSAADALAQQIGTGIELSGRRKDGSSFPIEIMLSPLESREGILVTAAIRDISVRKDAEQHLAQMEGRYRGLLEAAPDAMVVVDQAGNIVLLNVQAEKRFGYSRDELLAQKVTAIIPNGFAERLIADGTRTAAEALEQQIGTGIELSGRRKDGSDFPIEIMLSPLDSKEGILVTAAIRDITVRKDAELHLAQVEGKYRGLLEAAPDGMVVVDQGGKMVLLNLQAEKLFGYHRQELVGQQVTDIIPVGFAERLIADGTRTASEALAQQIGTGIELSGRCKNGSDFPIEIMLSPLESPDGVLVTAAIRDISVRKKADADQLQTLGELKRSNDELEHFAYVASHDLQEPLRMVASYTQLLGKRYKGKLDADADDFIAFAVAGCNRMQRLINDLLAYSRAGANGKTPRKISSELALREALTNLETSIAESGALVTHDALPVVTMDDTQLTQVFQNLIGNAVKYRSAAAPRVHVSANTNDSTECVFSVRDNGLGIDAQYFEKIFILFQRLHGRDEFEGTGIGLAVCKKMLERLGGRIWLDSQPDKGSTFHFAVPEGIAK
jgi:PAS domain S-box-containing protein